MQGQVGTGERRMQNTDLPEDWFEMVKAAYPKRDGGQGWPIARRKIECALADGTDFERILLGTRNYAAYCKRTGKVGTEMTMQAQRFFGPGMYWDEYADIDARSPAQVAQDAKWEGLERRARALGFNTVDRKRGYDVALSAVEQAEKKNERAVIERAGLRLVAK
jgi:hypothetical protein